MTLADLIDYDLSRVDDPSSKALEIIMTNLANYFSREEYEDNFTIAVMSQYMADTWTARIWLELVRFTEEVPASAVEWQAFFYHCITHQVFGRRLPRNAPSLTSERECQIFGCDETPEEWDHVLPHSWGGPNETWNFKHLCKRHNRMKSSSLSMFTRLVRDEHEYKGSFIDWIKNI